MKGRCWKEIDLNVIKNNYLYCQKLLKKEQKIMAVVKADAYGHGGAKVAKALQGLGCEKFAVATVKEGVVLRKKGVLGEILILGYTPKKDLKTVVEYGLCQALYSDDYARILQSSRLPIKVHIAVDTGMNRLGFSADEKGLKSIEKLAEKFKIEGVYTHLSSADENDGDEFTACQIERFKKVVKGLSFAPKSVHYANSKGFLRFNESFADTVRLGICLYGLGDCKGVSPALEWKSAVTSVKFIKNGESVGYGRSFIANKNMKIITVGCGYADGYFRGLSNCGKVVIGGQIAPVVGKICMDSFMVDATAVSRVKIGDEVVLLGKKFSAKDMAFAIGTIDYEIVTAISQRVGAVYK